MKIALASLFCLIFAAAASGADKDWALSIGDPAPQLAAIEWIKGEPVTEFKQGRVYVVEFWATWCGPCIKAMPHLSELSKKYADRVTFVGVHVEPYERFRIRIAKRPLQDYLAGIRAFVAEQGANLSYTAAVDQPLKTPIFSSWMAPAGFDAVPATFLVDGAGKIAWIGHPMTLDKPLAQLLDGNLDLEASREAHRKLAADFARNTADSKKYEAAFMALERKDFPAMLEAVERELALHPKDPLLTNYKLKALLHVDEVRGKAFAQSILSDAEQPKWTPCSTATAINEEEGLSNDIYRFGIGIAEKSLQADAYAGGCWNAMALGYMHLKDFSRAAAAAEKAVALAKEEGYAPALIQLYEMRLAEYRERLKST